MDDDRYSEPDENGRQWWAGHWIDTGEKSNAYHHATLLEIQAYMKHYNTLFGHHVHRIAFRPSSGPPSSAGEDDITHHPMPDSMYIWD